MSSFLRRNAAALLLALIASLILPTAGKAQDPSKGKDLFERRCGGCHSLDRDKEGPRLRDVYGRVSGAAPLFKYSDALKKARITWDSETLDKWLTDTDKLVPDNDMTFRVVKADERSDIIAYLKQLSGK